MTAAIIQSQASDGAKLQATFLPEKGMNLISFKRGDIEVIDQSTVSLFDERFAGLGALIGPHFHRRYTPVLPKIADETLFPHIARVKAKGVQDPFSHGIARYAPWKSTNTESSISAVLTGKDTWNGLPLAALEGQNFTMHYRAAFVGDTLQIDMDIVSDVDSVVGIHYYYHLPQGKGMVVSEVQPDCLIEGKLQKLQPEWRGDAPHKLAFNLDNEADYTFYPYPDPRKAKIVLDAISYRLTTTYESPSQENCWQLYHPKGASFVCVEPISAQDPRHPNLTVSSLKITLEVIVPN